MAGTITDTYISMTNEANIAGYSYTAVAALLLYEYVITLGEESRVIWRDFRAGYATLFMINRFNMICMFIAAVGETIPLHNIVGCKATLIFALVVDLNIYLTWAAVSTLRMYAISSCNVYLAIVTGVLAFAPVVTNIAGNTKNAFYISQVDAPDGCYAVPGLSPQIDLTLLILTRAATIASDVLVLIVTWRQLLGTVHCVQSSKLRETWARSTLAALVLRDGTGYFVFFLLMNVALIIAGLTIESIDPPTTFMGPMTCIVISRLTLNLRQFAYERHEASIPEASRLGSHPHQASSPSVAVFRVDSHLSDGPGAFGEV